MTVLEALIDAYKLTQRQATVLGLIIASIDERGYPPTCRELQKLCGFTSPNGVTAHVDALERKGAIKPNPQHEARYLVPQIRWISAAELRGKQ